MEFKPHLFKSWFNVEEIHRLLKNNYKLEYSHKEIIKNLAKYPHIVEILFYAEYYGETNQLILGKQEQPFGKLEIKKNPRFPDEYLTRYFDALSAQPEITYTAENSELRVKCLENTPEIQHYKGLLFVPEFCLTESMLSISDENSLILPETAFYDPFDFFREHTKAIFSRKFRPDYLFMRFNGAMGQGVLNIADLRIHADDFSYIANIFEYEAQQQEEIEDSTETVEQASTPQPPKTEENTDCTKNKRNKKEESKKSKLDGVNKGKKFYLESILKSCESTAKVNPSAGGYTVVNAVLKGFKERYNLTERDHFYVDRHYLDMLKERGVKFPDNRGIKGEEIRAIIELVK